MGDRFLKGLWPSIIAAKTNLAGGGSNSLPYLFNNYNVIPRFAGANTMGKSLLATILNQVIQGINETDHLPRYILLMLDKDVVENIQFGGFGCKIIFECTIEWLSSRIKNAINTRKEDLKQVKIGAFEPGEPRIVWIKMLIRPFIKTTSHGYVFAQCHTFNTILQSTILKFLHTHVLDTELPTDRALFDLGGNLSPTGKDYFWKEVNYWMRRFDRGKTELRPEADPPRKSKKLKKPSTATSFNNTSLENAYHYINI